VGTFALVIGLSFLFVFGAALGMRPSPHQARIARLRAAASGAGLRVRLAPPQDGGRISPDKVVYVLPWHLEQLEQVRDLHFRARRQPDGGWCAETLPGVSELRLHEILNCFPAGVTEFLADAGGLAMRWDERGSERDIEGLAQNLGALREACPGGRLQVTPTQSRT
jgi:hypothetical protein